MRPGKYLLVVFLGAVSLSACDEDLINPMAARQPRVTAYGGSEFYDDGLSMRQPPPGTVPRERMLVSASGNPGITTGKNGDAYVTQIPMPVDDTLMRLGRKRYDITCGTCHGPAGDGDSIVARQMGLRPPPSLHKYTDRPPGYIYEVITKGFGLMASYATELPVRDRWAVVAYVRALQVSQTSSLDKAPPEERARLEKESP